MSKGRIHYKQLVESNFNNVAIRIKEQRKGNKNNNKRRK